MNASVVRPVGRRARATGRRTTSAVNAEHGEQDRDRRRGSPPAGASRTGTCGCRRRAPTPRCPSAQREPERGEREPGLGREHRRVGEEPRRDPHDGPPDEREHPAARGPRQPVAGGDEQRHRGGDDQAPHRPARAPAGPVSKRRTCDEVEVGAEREARARPCRRPRARTRAATGTAARAPPSDATIARPNARSAMPRRPGDRDRDARTRRPRATKRPSPAGYHAPSNAREHRAAAAPGPGARRRRARRGATTRSSRNGSSANSTSGPSRPSAIALRATGLMPYARPAASAGPRRPMTCRDRAGTRRTRRAGSRATTVRVCASPTAPRSTVPDAADQRERRRRRRRRPEPGVAPRRPEGVEQVADPRPVRRTCRSPGPRR